MAKEPCHTGLVVCCNTILICIISAERNILRCINKVSKKLLYKKNRHLRSISNPTGVKTKGVNQLL